MTATRRPTPTSRTSSAASPATAARPATAPTSPARGTPPPMPISRPSSASWPAAPADRFQHQPDPRGASPRGSFVAPPYHHHVGHATMMTLLPILGLAAGALAQA